MMVNFMCQLAWAKDAHIAGETLFLGVSGGGLEEEIATYSGIVAWKIPWTGEPG